MSKPVVKRAPKKKGANGYKLPDPIPKGEILTDVAKKQWKLGPSIGVGGFGEIYTASEYGSKTSSKEQSYVVKIEPHGNGPLFVEMHFYMRNARKEDIQAWMKEKRIPNLGMPKYIGSGSHICKGQKYRFIVMERFGEDLWTVFLKSGRMFNPSTVFLLGQQLLDVLEYIHSRGYVHADIKGGNILMALDEKLEYQVYLVDFGLASHFTTKDFKLDPKKAHNGTIEYTSRDAHHGVPTCRGDLEILAYNMLQWLGHTLPWENILSDPIKVQQSKEKFMSEIKSALKNNFPKVTFPDALIKFFTYVSSMKYDTIPDYAKCRKIFEDGIRQAPGVQPGSLVFTTPPLKKSTARRKAVGDENSGSQKKLRAASRKMIVGENSSSDDEVEPFLNVASSVPFGGSDSEDAEPKSKRKRPKNQPGAKVTRTIRPRKLREQNYDLKEDSDEDSNDEVLKRNVKSKKQTPLKRQARAVKNEEATSEFEEECKLSKRYEKFCNELSESDMFASNDEDLSVPLVDTKPKIPRKRAVKNTVDSKVKSTKVTKPRVTKRSTKSNSTKSDDTMEPKLKPSWRDCPTILNGKSVK